MSHQDRIADGEALRTWFVPRIVSAIFPVAKSQRIWPWRDKFVLVMAGKPSD